MRNLLNIYENNNNKQNSIMNKLEPSQTMMDNKSTKF